MDEKITLTMSDGKQITIHDPSWKDLVDPEAAEEFRKSLLKTCAAINEAVAEADRRGVPLHEIIPVS